MLRPSNLKILTGEHGGQSPGLHSLSIITENEALKSPESIPDISIDESFLTAGTQAFLSKKQLSAKAEPHYTKHNFAIPSESLCGARIAVFTQTSTGQSKRRSVATIAGIFRIGDRRFALTVAHIFFDDEAKSATWTDSRVNTARCCNDDIGKDNLPPRIAETYEVVIENYWPNNGDPDLHTRPTNIPIGSVAPSVLHRRKRPETATLPEVIWDADLDWALIELQDSAFWHMNMLHLSPSIDLELKPPAYDQKAPSGDVIIAGGVSGAVLGFGLNSTESIKMPRSKSEIETWTIESDEIAVGDIGAMVVDPRTGATYGMVVSSDSEKMKTQVVPASSIFESIFNRQSNEDLTLTDLYSVGNNTSAAATLVEDQAFEEYLRTPVVRSANTNVADIFQTALKNFSLQSIDGRRFVRRSALTKWLLSPRRDGIPHVDFMLDQAYPRNKMMPVTREQISDGDTTCLVVFSLLYEIGCAELIHLFLRQGLTDSRLPFDFTLLNEAVDRMDLPDPDDVADQVFQKQWAYCPMNFDLEMERDIPTHIVIPIHHRQQINSKGDNATLWQVTVLEEFVGKRLQTASIRARFNDPLDNLGHRYHFAVKSFAKHQSAHFETEITAFKAFRTVPSMIGYLGNYHCTVNLPRRRAPSFSFYEEKRTEQGPAETNNILLEYGDYDLDEYFAATQPPVISVQVTQFWQDMAGIAEAVSEVHQFSTRRAGVRQQYSGWHADIKPDNILNVKGIFKLADPGVARFEKSEKKLTILVGGTKTYGSPEAHCTQQRNDRPVSQAIDIWSLGCVLSVAATWVILGWSGVNQYQQLRIEAVKRLSGLSPNINRNRSHSRSRSRSTGRASGLSVNGGMFVRPGFHTPDGDCFHDGEKVLEEVLCWHQFLRSIVRKSDEVSVQMLDLIDTKMLVAHPGDRIGAADLYKQMRLMVQNCDSSSYGAVTDVISQILSRTDDGPAVSVPRMSAMSVSSARCEPSPAAPNFKVSNRSLLSPSPNITLNSSVTVASSAMMSDASSSQAVAAAEPRPLPLFRGTALPETANRSVSDSIDVPTDQRGPPRGASLKPARRMSVSQAKAELDRKKKVFSRKKKDPFLVSHLENRDIEFLIDNGDTMIRHWRETTDLIEILTSMVADIDKDGFDLTFTTGTTSLKQKSNTKAVRSTMESSRTKPTPGTRTDMSDALNRALGQYCSRLRSKSLKSSSSSSKNYTLIVLTDGIWRGTSEAHSVEDTIIRRMNEIARIDGSRRRDRAVTIQFVQFGRDEEATHRLEALDRGLIDYEIPDIIDTEPSDGNVLKMLLGSVDADFDYADGSV